MVHITQSDCDMGQICDSGQCFRMYRIPQDTADVTDIVDVTNTVDVTDTADTTDTTDTTEYELVAHDKYLRVTQKSGKRGENEIFFDCSQEEYDSIWKAYFDLNGDTDYAYIKSMVRKNREDIFLNDAVNVGGGIRILRQDLWEMIVSFLISQQNNIPRIHKCIENICRKYGNVIIPESMSTKSAAKSGTKSDSDIRYTFPAPEKLAELPEDGLMECNLGYRSKYVVRTAREIVEGKFNLDEIARMDYRQGKDTLLKMYGVGNKVADCICLFALHHLEAFPVDTHIKQICQREYGGKMDVFDRFAGVQGVIQQYIFYAELQNIKKS